MNKNLTQVTATSVKTSLSSIENFLNMSLDISQSSTEATSVQLAYHEMAAIPVRETDVLEQLEKNIQTLSDLRSRLQFMNRELRYLMKV